MHLTVAYQEPTGYKYVETSPDLKEAAAALPCFAALHWPDYATKVFDDEINGKPGSDSVVERLVPAVSEFAEFSRRHRRRGWHLRARHRQRFSGRET